MTLRSATLHHSHRRPVPLRPLRLSSVPPRRVSGIPLPLLAVLLPLLPACSSGETGLAAGDRPLAVEVTPLHSVGSQAGDRWDSFSRVTALAFGRDGRLHVLDADARRVVVVGPDGEHLLTFGTAGEGPGQFRMPGGMAVLEDGTVAVFDAGHRAFLLFDASGAFVRSVPVSVEEGMPGQQLLAHGDLGVVSVARGVFVRSVGGGPPTMPTTAPVRRFGLGQGGEAATLHEAWLPPRELPSGALPVPGGSGGPSIPNLPGVRAFEPQPLLAALPDGRLAVADSSTWRIRLLDPTGAPAGTLERDVPPLPVGEQERQAERSRRLQELEEGRGPRMQIQMVGPGGSMSFDERQMGEMMRGRIESMDFWPEIPVLRELAADPEGRLWVARSGGVGEPGPLDILAPDGSYLGTVAPGDLDLPAAFGPEGRAAWIRRDELEVPYVEVARIRLGG
jgi:hypothetical protein